MAPTISKTSESVTQLEGAKRLLDNLILWRYVKRTLLAWLKTEEEEEELGVEEAIDPDDRKDELQSTQLMCEWMETIQPCLEQAHHVAEVLGEDILDRIRARLSRLDPDGKIQEARQNCVVCSRRVPFPLNVVKENQSAQPTDQTANDDDEESSNNVTNCETAPPPPATPNLATSTQAYVAACVAGHQLGRCCRTLLPCSRVPYRVCVVCGSTSLDPLSLPQDDDALRRGLAKLLTINCSLCDGLLVSR